MLTSGKFALKDTFQELVANKSFKATATEGTMPEEGHNSTIMVRSLEFDLPVFAVS